MEFNPFNWFATKKSETRAIDAATVERHLNVVDVSSSGVNISEHTALQLSAVFCAVNVVSEGIASLDLFTYRLRPGGGKDEAIDHPVYDLLLHNPNSYQTPANFWQTLVANALIWGNGLAVIDRTGMGEPVSLRILPNQYVDITGDEAGPLYVVRVPGTEPAFLRQSDVFHVHGLSPDGSIGYRLVQMARDTLGFVRATEAYGQSFFKNACRPGGIFKSPVGLSAEAVENLRNSANALNGGVGAAGKNMVLEDGLEWTPFATASAEASQYDETRKLNCLAVCQFFNVPPSMLKLDIGSRPGGNLESDQQSFLWMTLRPWLKKITQECHRKLFTQFERQVLTVEHDTIDYLSGSFVKTLDIGIRARIFLPNEAREWLGLDPVEGLDDLPPQAGPAQTENNANGNPVDPVQAG